MRRKKFIYLLLATLLTAVFLSGCTDKDSRENPEEICEEKPVIYLYPEEVTDVTVQLDYDGELTCTYPAYNNGWHVTAYPDGTLFNHSDKKEYTTLFWEGVHRTDYDLSEGFVIAGKDTADFLDEKLAYLGLNVKERNEFIMYWLPRMQDNPYNLITFQGDAYTDSAHLEISPQPDAILRVFMAFQRLDTKINVKEQTLTPTSRNGFTVVEWGGCEIK